MYCIYLQYIIQFFESKEIMHKKCFDYPCTHPLWWYLYEESSCLFLLHSSLNPLVWLDACVQMAWLIKWCDYKKVLICVRKEEDNYLEGKYRSFSDTK